MTACAVVLTAVTRASSQLDLRQGDGLRVVSVAQVLLVSVTQSRPKVTVRLTMLHERHALCPLRP